MNEYLEETDERERERRSERKKGVCVCSVVRRWKRICNAEGRAVFISFYMCNVCIYYLNVKKKIFN